MVVVVVTLWCCCASGLFGYAHLLKASLFNTIYPIGFPRHLIFFTSKRLFFRANKQRASFKVIIQHLLWCCVSNWIPKTSHLLHFKAFVFPRKHQTL